MEWLVFFILSLACFLLSIALAVKKSRSKYRIGDFIDPAKILFVGVVVASLLLFVPIYWNALPENCKFWEYLLIPIHNMIKLFVVDADFSDTIANIAAEQQWLNIAYSLLFSVYFVFAPILTFGFVLSFFKNISAYKEYITHYHSDVYIFSELNEKSLALAKSLDSNPDKNRFFVFTDVFTKEDDRSYELVEQAMQLGSVCFKKDINSVDFTRHSKSSEINFLVISENEDENVSHALSLITKFKYRENTNLYVFSTLVESEMLLAAAFNKQDDGEDAEKEAPKMKIRVRRVDEVQSLVFRTLFEQGYEKIFQSATELENGQKQISAVLVGMGKHGTEMAKALAWFCQMDGYIPEITAYDITENAASVFASKCPELVDPKLNGVYDIDGEMKLKITVNGGVDVKSKDFDDAVAALPNVTYVFVALGEDGDNISTAVKLRGLFAKKGISPVIQAIVYNTDKRVALDGITNFKGQPYDIDFIGDMETSYSEEVVLDSDVEELALARHMKWGNEDDFWKYGYNYRSSIASAIHTEMKKKCGIPGVEKKPCDREDGELWALRKLEHCRWNAYMRSQGYVFAPKRNDLAKTHHCLVPFDELPLAEQIKDDD